MDMPDSAKFKAAKHVDVLILGGGPAGSSAGLNLLKRGDLSVMIVERGNYLIAKFGESLPSSVRSNLEYLGVWDEFVASQNLAPFYSRVAWGSSTPKQIAYMFTPNGAGWELDRLAFERMLADNFVARGGELLCHSQVVTCVRQSERGWRVEIKSDGQEMQTIFCKYIIDASGRRGVMRTNLNLALTVYDRLIGVACIGDLPKNCQLKAENQVEACEYGWWYISSMPGNRVSVVLMSDPDIVNRMQACHPDVWRALLRNLTNVEESVRCADFTEMPRSFPCYSSYLSATGGKDWVAVGDAVASYDPISSTGIPRALTSGIHGAFIAVDSLFSKGDLLSTYAQAIEQDFKQYLQTQWQYYQRETRWPEAVFWARRRAVIGISKESTVRAAHPYQPGITRAPIHLKAVETHDLWLLCTPGKPLRQIVAQFSAKYLHLPETKIILGLQELVESGYLEISIEEEEDCVFFNTDRLYFS
ncbi:NAD(P)/FAD-dependent oxidoreductase [Undibacterium sp. Di24W]|uniref:NAD(P)/FAD-dependent oxidoreductase n=1 Tax=Undibacterium sp. Di24W TaxID=3413033 RepID=UPI003BF34462